MSPQQTNHAKYILGEFGQLMLAKYEKGAKEHNSNIWEYPPEQLIDFAIEEAIDQVVYLLTLKESMKNG